MSLYKCFVCSASAEGPLAGPLMDVFCGVHIAWGLTRVCVSSTCYYWSTLKYKKILTSTDTSHKGFQQRQSSVVHVRPNWSHSRAL